MLDVVHDYRLDGADNWPTTGPLMTHNSALWRTTARTMRDSLLPWMS